MKSNLSQVEVQIPDKLIPVFMGDARYRGSYGGRGSGKTRTFAKMAAIRAYQLGLAGKRGLIVCAREYMNSLADSSFAEVKEAISLEPWLTPYFDIGDRYIRTRDGNIDFAFIGLRHNLDSIKSKAKIFVLWVDEGDPVSEMAWIKAIPTVREEGSEIWVTWNPERKASATHKRFRQNPPAESKIVEMNWRDNPWFPEVLEKERLNDKENRPEQYEHIWEGGFISVMEGAYYSKHITIAKEQKRININVAPDPLLTIRLYADIGGTGAKSDNFVFWVAQFSGKEIWLIDYYEVQGQPLAYHLGWLRKKNYIPETAQIWLPHDGETNDRVYDVSYESAFSEAGYKVTVIPNQGKGAAMSRVEAGRRLFTRCWFDNKCQPGLDALGWYHEKKDEERQIGLGPDHDWSSHSADAFGLMSIAYEPPKVDEWYEQEINYPKSNVI